MVKIKIIVAFDNENSITSMPPNRHKATIADTEIIVKRNIFFINLFEFFYKITFTHSKRLNSHLL